MSERVVRVYPASASWLLSIDDEWDSMTEEQRQDYIWEAAMDNGKVSFDYEPKPLPAAPSAPETDCNHGVVVQNGCPHCERRAGYKLESGDETETNCQHDLLKPECTVKVTDKGTRATCSECREVWTMAEFQSKTEGK